MYWKVIFIYFIASKCLLLVPSIPSGSFGKARKSEFIQTNNNNEHLTNEPSVNGNNRTGGRNIFAQEDLTKGNTHANAHQSESSEHGDTKTTNILPLALGAKYNGNKTEKEIDRVARVARGDGGRTELETIHRDETLPGTSDFHIVEGDMLFPKSSATKTLVLSDNDLWPDKTVHYQFVDSEFTISERHLVESAIQDLRMRTCVRFVHKTFQDTYLRFRNNGFGCASAVGYTRLGAGLDIFLGGRVCFVRGKIQHEILHALGFWHEHSRPDRDSFIRVRLENVAAGQEINMERRRAGTVRTFGFPYDYGSLMHYSGKAFSKDGTSRTIIPLYPGGEDIIGQREAMSRVDLAKVNRLYKCPEEYYQGHDIKGAYSVDGPISRYAYLPSNKVWFSHIGADLDERATIRQFFSNSAHFSKPRPNDDEASPRAAGPVTSFHVAVE